MLRGRIPTGLQPAAELDATALADEAIWLAGIDEATICQRHTRYGEPGRLSAVGERR